MSKTIIFFVIILILFLHPFEGSGDFYHHLNSGKYIFNTHTLPHLDIWTHSASGQPWVAHSWASGIVFYLLLTYLGPISISLFTAFVALSTMIGLYFYLKIFKVSQFINLAVVLLTSLIISTRYPQRPEILSYLFVILLLLIDQLKNRYPRLSLLFPLIILLWANFYGSGVLLGLLIIVFLILKQLFMDKFKITKSQRLFYLLSLITFPLSLFNGYGLDTIFYLNKYIPKVTTYEGEWLGILGILNQMPLSLLLTYQYYILIYFIFLVLLVLTILLSFKQVVKNFYPLCLSLAIFLPFLAFRQLPMAVLLSAPGLALSLNNLSQKTKIINYLLIFLIATTAALIIWLKPPSITRGSNHSLGDLTDFLTTQQISGRAFNSNNLGAYLTSKLYPQILVFFDTRDDLFVNTPVVEDLQAVSSSSRMLLPILKKYQIDLVVGNFGDQINYRDLFYSPDWAVVFFNDQYFIALPKQMAQKKNLTLIEAVDYFSSTGAKPGLEKEAASYYTKQLERYPDSANLKLFLAASLLGDQNYAEAIKVISSFEINPQAVSGSIGAQDKYFLLAQGYLGQGDCPNIKKALAQGKSFTQPVLLPFINRKISSQQSKVTGLYYLKCVKDLNQAKVYLDQYLNQPDITPLEKAKIIKELNDSGIQL